MGGACGASARDGRTGSQCHTDKWQNLPAVDHWHRAGARSDGRVTSLSRSGRDRVRWSFDSLRSFVVTAGGANDLRNGRNFSPNRRRQD